MYLCCVLVLVSCAIVFFQAEDGIRDLVRSRGLGDVYKRQAMVNVTNRADVYVRLRPFKFCLSHCRYL